MSKRPAWLEGGDDKEDELDRRKGTPTLAMGPMVSTDYNYIEDKSISCQQSIGDKVR